MNLKNIANSVISFLPVIAIFLIFYFMIVKPQKKKMKEHQDLINSLKTGDQVVTRGGIMCVVDKILKDSIVVKTAEDTKIKIVKESIQDFIK